MFKVLSKIEIEKLSHKEIVKYCSDLQMRRYENESLIDQLLELVNEEIDKRFGLNS